MSFGVSVKCAGLSLLVGLCISPAIGAVPSLTSFFSQAPLVGSSTGHSPTIFAGANAVHTYSGSVAPLVALSALSSPGAISLCAGLSSTAAIQAGSTEVKGDAKLAPPSGQETSANVGCVLPVVDQPVAVSEVAPLAFVALSPFILAVPAAAAAAAVIASETGDDNDNNEPISLN